MKSVHMERKPRVQLKYVAKAHKLVQKREIPREKEATHKEEN
jgi:hypothetical protein